MIGQFWLLIIVRTIGVFALSLTALIPQYAHSECQENMVYSIVDSVPDHLGSNDVALLFDGSRAYSGNQNLRFDNPASPGDNALVVNLTQSFLAGTTIKIYFENDDADGVNAEFAVKTMHHAGYGAWYWDRNGDGILGVEDLDANGDQQITIGDGDYSPVGLVIEFHNGDPSNVGTLVDTQYAPLAPIEQDVHLFVATAPAEFTHFTVESTPIDLGANPRLIEIEVDDIANSGGDLIVLRPWCAMECDCS